MTAVDRYDSFGNWHAQLRWACEDDRLADVAAIVALTPPARVVLEHVREVEEETDGWRSTRRECTVELVPWGAMASTPARAHLEPLPEAESEQAARLRHWLLRTPPEIGGPSCFWARSRSCLKLLLEAGASVDDHGWMGLPLVVHAAETGDLEILRYLVEERGLDPSEKRKDGGYAALHWATGKDVVRYLVEAGADLRARAGMGDTVLAQQVRKGDSCTIAYLLSLGPEHVDTTNAFHWIEPDPAMVRTLLAGGVPPHQRIPAVFGEHTETLLLHKLLRGGIHTWAKAEGDEAKTSAAQRLLRSVRLTLTYGFDPMQRDGTRQLPWHVVVDHEPVLDEGLFSDLRVLLADYDGPREDPPDAPRCTCGLHL